MKWPRMLFYTCISLGFILCLSACAATTACDSQTPKASQPVLLFQKTPCYGTCPAYNATFYADGSILYKGIRHTPVKGELQLCLPRRQNRKIQAAIEQLGISSLENNYLSPYTDVPSTYLTFYEQGKEIKRIKHQQGGTVALQEIIKLLDESVTQLVQQQASGSSE